VTRAAPATPTRKAELARIHVLAKQAGLVVATAGPPDDQLYRDMLDQAFGVRSAALLTAQQRRECICLLGGGAKAGSPQARFIRVLWGRLVAAGAVEHHAGLSAWIAAQTRRDTGRTDGWLLPEFCPPYVQSRLVEQLKTWLTRLGLDASVQR